MSDKQCHSTDDYKRTTNKTNCCDCDHPKLVYSKMIYNSQQSENGTTDYMGVRNGSTSLVRLVCVNKSLCNDDEGEAMKLAKSTMTPFYIQDPDSGLDIFVLIPGSVVALFPCKYSNYFCIAIHIEEKTCLVFTPKRGSTFVINDNFPSTLAFQKVSGSQSP